MMFEGLPEFVRSGLLGHLRQSLENLLFGEIHVPEQIDEKVL
jgi:hypothetical protein